MTTKTKHKKVILLAMSISAIAIIAVVIIISTMKDGAFQHNVSRSDSILQEAGQDAFGTIQEVMEKIYENPQTDWKKVNLEALRTHLLEMEDMTMNIEVLEQTRLENGIRVIIRPTTPRSLESMKKVMAVHPSLLKSEAGWDMEVKLNDDATFTLTTTTSDISQVDEIAGLGYIGLMAYGNHHQPHHWAIATGESDPHAHFMQH